MLAVLIGLLAASGALASKPIQLSLTPEIALFDRTETIEGLTLSLWGENPQTALALGIVNGYRWFTGLPDELAPGMILVNWCF